MPDYTPSPTDPIRNADGLITNLKSTPPGGRVTLRTLEPIPVDRPREPNTSFHTRQTSPRSRMSDLRETWIKHGGSAPRLSTGQLMARMAMRRQ